MKWHDEWFFLLWGTLSRRNIVLLWDKSLTMNAAPQYTFAHLPFIRLLLPLAVGIAWQFLSPSLMVIAVCCVVAVVAVVLSAATYREPLLPLHRYSFSVAVMAVMVTVGMFGCRVSLPVEELPAACPKSVAIARLEASPVQRQNSFQVRAVVVALTDDSDGICNVKIPVLLYMKPSYTAGHLRSGDLILFHPQLSRIRSSQIPYSFDFADYMRRNGVIYTQYLSDGDWQLSQRTARLSILDKARHVQTRCVEVLYGMGLSSDNAALLAALIWGYKKDVPATLRDCFSAAGLSHILAVSGLHTGIIAFLLWLLFFPLRYTPLRGVRMPVTLLLLWFYAFITGLSPSVVRSCIMASFVGVAAMLHRRNTTLNALLGSAVMVLLVSPLQLFDVGFQLSYVAVGGIVLLSPYLDISRRMDNSSAVLRYVSGMMSVSVAAQLATVPLAAYYFHYLPVWGLLANVFLVPLLPLLVLSALLSQLFASLALSCEGLVSVAESLTTLIVTGADSISSLPGAVVEGIWVTMPMLVGYALSFLCMWQILSSRSFRALPILAIIVIFMQLVALYESLRPYSPLALISAENRHTVMQLTDDERHCFVLTTATDSVFPKSGKEWRMRERLDSQLVFQQDTISTAHVYVALPFVRYYDKTLLWINDNAWRYVASEDKLKVDYAIVTEQYKGKISDLVRTFDIGQIVLSAAVYPARAERLKEEADFLNIACSNAGWEDVCRLEVHSF